MNPAPNARNCSMARRLRVACRVTASAPITLPQAASTAGTRALDTGEQILLGLARGVLQDFAEQLRERGADVGTGPHAGREQVVTAHGELLQRDLVAGVLDRLHHRGEGLVGSRCRRELEPVSDV